MSQIPMCIVHYILNFLHLSETKIISKYRYHIYRVTLMDSISRISNLYHRRLLLGDGPYDKVTLKTLKRFYIVKYKPEWLYHFPTMASTCLGINYIADKNYSTSQYVRKFLDFCKDINITKQDFWNIGW